MAGSIKDYIIGIIAFTLIIVGGITMYGLAASEAPSLTTDPTNKFTTFNSSFNKLNDVTNSVNSIHNNIVNSTVDAGAYGVLNALIFGSWNTLKLITSTFGFMTNVISDIGKIIAIPTWATALLIAAILVIISFAIYSLIFQRDT